jgi:glucan 1,6-alpha-glucosidase
MGYDPEAVMASIHARSRDNARTPMQWTAGANVGFSAGKPWVPVNPNYTEINAAAALEEENSVFHHYRKLIELRKTYPVFRDGSFTLLLPEDPDIFAYTRDTEEEHLLVVCNFTDKELHLDAPEAFCGAQVLLANYLEPAQTLRPYEAVMLYYKEV